jgi:ribosomal protein S18 acetylase RimI-like enzyme
MRRPALCRARHNVWISAHQPHLFLVGTVAARVMASAMAGYDGHRGWVFYLAVHPDFQGLGHGKK